MNTFGMRTLVVAFLLAASSGAWAQWEPAGDKIKTEWAAKVDAACPLPEYPRPQMERKEWKNLNGLWRYAIRQRGEMAAEINDGQILVPFAIESSLSGVMKTVGRDQELWYERTFTVPADWKGRDVLLHFGAVDWRTEVWVNDVKIGAHQGGYGAFSFNITPYLTKGEQRLVVKVWDPSSDGFQPRGKQVTRPEGIWYTPVTGIWQTVWMEPVHKAHITRVVPVPDIDHGRLDVEVDTKGVGEGDVVHVTLRDGQNVVAEAKAVAGLRIELPVKDAKLWSPDSPFLYDMDVELLTAGKAVDHVQSYAAMRKIGTRRDESGIMRLTLNNQDLFQFGPLDQGYWPDGLYTAPTDEALAYDIVKTKEYGFNMIRKHMKVEPARWFTHCDRLGILVWQDMPSGDRTPEWQMYKYFDGAEIRHSEESEANFIREWQEIIEQHKAYPSVVVWTPFNEAWGQFRAHEIVAMTKQLDPSRLVNPASGGNHYPIGDMLDIHNYPGPVMKMFDPQRPTVLGEYGGLGLPMEGHLWKTDGNWGYIQFKNRQEVTDRYCEFAAELRRLARNGYAAAVYTQTTDVEGEVNGLMTYDRKVLKLDVERVRKANQAVIDFLRQD